MANSILSFQRHIRLIFIGLVVVALLSGCSEESIETAQSVETPAASRDLESGVALTAGEVEFTATVWADNWFSLYVNGVLVGEDSVPITTEMSFNSEIINFRATYPLTIAMITKDFKQNDSGLEYIGSALGFFDVGAFFTLFQQMGDGGFIAQIAETDSGEIIAGTSESWRGLIIHKAPLNPSCEKSWHPEDDCDFMSSEEPSGWRDDNFDDSRWLRAVVYTPEQIGTKPAYNRIDWDSSAKLIWTSDLKADNTILWRYQIPER